MTVQFYVSEDGEVLSNKEYPVKAPMVMLPEIAPHEPHYCAAASSLALERLRIRHTLYRAVTVECPDVLFETRDGLIQPAGSSSG